MEKKLRKQLPQTVTIKRDESQPESLELVAQAILDIDAAFKRMLAGRASTGLIVLLLHDMTGVGKPAIRTILAAVPKIADTYLKR